MVNLVGENKDVFKAFNAGGAWPPNATSKFYTFFDSEMPEKKEDATTDPEDDFEVRSSSPSIHGRMFGWAGFLFLILHFLVGLQALRCA